VDSRQFDRDGYSRVSLQEDKNLEDELIGVLAESMSEDWRKLN